MLEWAAEQPTEITMTAIDLEFFPTNGKEFAADTHSAHEL